ncbi:hypothetical protein NPIL_183701, partial [Nephila pilipes]
MLQTEAAPSMRLSPSMGGTLVIVYNILTLKETTYRKKQNYSYCFSQ